MNRICHMFMTSLVFTGAFLIMFDGRFAIFGELYLLHVYKIVALSSFFLFGVHSILVFWCFLMFWSCLFASVPMCFAFHGLFVFWRFCGRRMQVQYFRNAFCLLIIDSTWNMRFFRCHRSAIGLGWIGYKWLLRCTRYYVLHPIGCSAKCTGLFMRWDYQIWTS